MLPVEQETALEAWHSTKDKNAIIEHIDFLAFTTIWRIFKTFIQQLSASIFQLFFTLANSLLFSLTEEGHWSDWKASRHQNYFTRVNFLCQFLINYTMPGYNHSIFYIKQFANTNSKQNRAETWSLGNSTLQFEYVGESTVNRSFSDGDL